MKKTTKLLAMMMLVSVGALVALAASSSYEVVSVSGSTNSTLVVSAGSTARSIYILNTNTTACFLSIVNTNVFSVKQFTISGSGSLLFTASPSAVFSASVQPLYTGNIWGVFTNQAASTNGLIVIRHREP